MAEEVVCCGYMQNGLLVRWGLVISIIVQSLFFAFLHSMNPGIKFMPVMNLFLYAVFIGLLFYYTDNLWIAGGVHSIWNFILGPVMGIEVSGIVMPSTIFKSSFTGAEILTGGSFGMEGSIFTTIVMSLGSLIVVYLLYTKKKEGEKK